MRTTPAERAKVIQQLRDLGIDYHDADRLRRCSKVLHRWAEQECGNGNDFASWSIERDEQTGKPYRCVYPHKGQNSRIQIPDREAGALKRIVGTLKDYPGLTYYHQTDPRGAAVYILRRSDVNGQQIDQVYNRGVAVY